MLQLEIRQLGPDDEAAFLAGVESWAGEDPAWHTFIWTEGMTHEAHLQRLSDDFHGRNLEDGRVSHTMLYGFLDGVIVGRCSIRHELNDYLREWGGHLGYGVAPEFRKRGFGQQLFRAGREHLRSLGTEKAFMTCDKDNPASRKMIEGAGGVLQDEVIDPNDQKAILRFWVSLV